MYLKKLYQHHKGWFLFIVLFIAGQIIINYKRGIVCSPFYHFGMYSSVITPEKIYIIPEVVVNGEVLQTKNYSPQEWDKIILPITLNEQQEQWNSNLYNGTIKRLLHVQDSLPYLNNYYSSTAFRLWYTKYLSSFIKANIDSLGINFNILAYSQLIAKSKK